VFKLNTPHTRLSTRSQNIFWTISSHADQSNILKLSHVSFLTGQNQCYKYKLLQPNHNALSSKRYHFGRMNNNRVVYKLLVLKVSVPQFAFQQIMTSLHKTWTATLANQNLI